MKEAFAKTFLNLETADTQKQRQQGLQNREQLNQYEGMLFNFPTSEKQSIWMKDTEIALDIIFLNENGEVLNIEQGEPQSTEHIFSDGSCKHVLELRQGKADDLNIKPGDDLSSLIQKQLKN